MAISLLAAIETAWTALGLAGTVAPLVTDIQAPGAAQPYAVLEDVGTEPRGLNSSRVYWEWQDVAITIYTGPGRADCRVRGETVRDALDFYAGLVMSPGSVSGFRRLEELRVGRDRELSASAAPVWKAVLRYRATVNRRMP